MTDVFFDIVVQYTETQEQGNPTETLNYQIATQNVHTTFNLGVYQFIFSMGYWFSKALKPTAKIELWADL